MHLIINPSDIYYLTGVRPHDPGEILIISDIDAIRVVFCDLRTSALFDKKQYHVCDVRGKWDKVFATYTNLNTDPDFLTQTLREKIEGYGVSLFFTKSPISARRVIKNNQEIHQLKKSQQLNKTVYEKILPFLQIGATEVDIARKIQMFQLECGASGPSFPPIVAFGENAAVPHHSPTNRALQNEDIILLDLGLVYGGYCSDMTRMVYQECISDEARAIGELVTEVTQNIIGWAKPGTKVSELDKKARTLLGEYEPYFTHSLGHGVGIDIHEAPWISAKSDEILEEGMVITIEPGIYIAGKYGARYEEMCVIDKNGLQVL